MTWQRATPSTTSVPTVSPRAMLFRNALPELNQSGTGSSRGCAPNLGSARRRPVDGRRRNVTLPSAVHLVQPVDYQQRI